MSFGVFAVGFVVLFVGGLIFFAMQDKKRTAALQQVSASLGMTFEAKGDVGQLRALGDLALFDLGRMRAVRNVISGRSGADDVKVFDYQYTMGGGKGATTLSQTVAFYPGRGRGLPEFLMMPENFLTKMGEKKLGIKDINFDSSPTFSSEYQLRGPDEAAIRSAFSEDVRRSLESQAGWTVDARGGAVAIFRYNRTVKPQDLRAFIEQSLGVLRTICPR